MYLNNLVIKYILINLYVHIKHVLFYTGKYICKINEFHEHLRILYTCIIHYKYNLYTTNKKHC